MKKFFLFLLLVICFSCGHKQCGDRYIKISESQGVNPEFKKKYGVLEQKIVVILDSENDELIYYDLWAEKIIERVSIKKKD